MATIRKRGDKWHVQVRRKDRPSVTRSFPSKADALAWARKAELEADRGDLPVDRRVLARVTVAEVLIRYRDEVSPGKRGCENETSAINALLRHSLARLSLNELTLTHVATYRDERLRTVKPTTLNRQLDVFRHAFELARREWQIPLAANPFSEVSRPKMKGARERRIDQEELDRLLAACRQCRSPLLGFMTELALETAMRRGELLNARWCDVNLAQRTLHIPLTKNGHPRTIPLTCRAVALIRQLEEHHDGSGRLIPLTLDSMRMSWKRTIRRSNLIDFHFHDLRHEAVSRFFELGLSIPEVALISGHKDPRMLFRYTHPKAQIVAAKLIELTSR